MSYHYLNWRTKHSLLFAFWYPLNFFLSIPRGQFEPSILMIMKKTLFILFAAVLIASAGCKKLLEAPPKAEFSPDNVLTSEKGLKALLYSSYGFLNNVSAVKDIVNISEVSTDMAFNTGGNENLYLTQFINFAWDPSTGQLQGLIWGPYYKCIRDANLVLENVSNVNAPDAIKQQYTAEARFLRAYAYAYLYSWYGSVPLRTSNDQPANLARASEQEIKDFVESELNACVADLPEPGKEELLGRATKGAALATLTKFFLNTRQWQKAVDASKKVIDLNYYSLYPVFKDMFKVENEGNKEMVFVMSGKNETNLGNWFPAGAMPPAFSYTDQLPEYKWTPGIQNFATQYRLRDAFVNTFSPTDARFVLVVRTYVNTSGKTVNLQSTPDNTRSLKYFDNNAVKNDHGNDFPLYRYADILLSRAEALNELGYVADGEAFFLLNKVRTRASLPNYTSAQEPNQSAFRDAILRERGWEFFSEGKRREDLIRQKKFISKAVERGVANARDFRILFPIPQSEVDANNAIVQNPGY